MSGNKKEVRIINNLSVYEEDNYVVVKINPQIYCMDCILSASYFFMDRVYIIINGDPEKEVSVELRPKEKGINLEELGREYNNELLSNEFSNMTDESGSENLNKESVELKDISWEEKYAKHLIKKR